MLQQASIPADAGRHRFLTNAARLLAWPDQAI
jgi:hypothetical protein